MSCAAIKVLEVRRVGSCGVVAGIKAQIGPVIIDPITVTQWPPDTGPVRVNLPHVETDEEFVSVEILDPQVKAEFDEIMLIAAGFHDEAPS